MTTVHTSPASSMRVISVAHTIVLVDHTGFQWTLKAGRDSTVGEGTRVLPLLQQYVLRTHSLTHSHSQGIVPTDTFMDRIGYRIGFRIG